MLWPASKWKCAPRELFNKFVQEHLKFITSNGSVLDPATVNKYPNPLQKAEPDILESSASTEIQKEVTRWLLDGNLVLQFLFAGVATRAQDLMTRYPKYFLTPALARYGIQSILPEEKDPRRRQIMEQTLHFLDAHPVQNISLGARQLWQYQAGLRSLARASDASFHAVLKKIHILVHVNEETAEDILGSFRDHRFFGFYEENIIFIEQQNFPGHIFKNRELVAAPEVKRPFGHGFTLSQVVTPNTGYNHVNGRKVLLKKSPLEHVRSRLGSAHVIVMNVNVDDLTKLSPQFLSPDRLHYAFHQIRKGRADVVVEVVRNLKGQKGGSWVEDTETGQAFLVEGLALKSPEGEALFRTVAGQPLPQESMPFLNKMANAYKADALIRHLKNKLLPHYLDLRQDLLFMESITGDITQKEGLHTCAFAIVDDQGNPEPIRTFKSAEDILETFQAMSEQDAQWKQAGFSPKNF
jgi:hypothetical protein